MGITRVLTAFLIFNLSLISADEVVKFCLGTNGRMSVPSDRELHYENLKSRYTNCTHVDGNLEITWIQERTSDLSFLENIREVSGYVLISYVDVDDLRLPELKIIRGETLLELNSFDEKFGLFVVNCQMQTLQLPSLTEISRGSVGNVNNYNACHLQSIAWSDILSENAKELFKYDFSVPPRDCPPCHSTCTHGCWAEGAENCQQVTKIACAENDLNLRCFAKGPLDYCHPFCAGGCTGPTASDCASCSNFRDNGTCKDACRDSLSFDFGRGSWSRHRKPAHGHICVSKCPEFTHEDEGKCVRECPTDKSSVEGRCEPCDGLCPKECVGEGLVHSGNVRTFEGCTIVRGSVHITDQTFAGFQQVFSNFSFGPRFGKMHPSELEAFASVREISGYLKVSAAHDDFRSLRFFRSLERIGGEVRAANSNAALVITMTSLREISMESLKEVTSGAIIINDNAHLCIPDSVNWSSVKKSSLFTVKLERNGISEACDELEREKTSK